MICALDFDRTLFDTEKDFAEAYARGVAHLIGTPELHEYIDPHLCVYPDSIPFLQMCGDRYPCYIVSAVTAKYGPRATEYQLDKIVRSGVGEYVADIILTGESKVEALATLSRRFPNERIVFVDDKVDHLIEVQNALPHVHCIHMCRDGAEVKSTVATPENMTTIHTLDSLLAHIATL